MLLRLAVTSLVALSLPLTRAVAELPPSATILDDNLLWDVTDPDTAVVSPDGQQIAYISRGAIWRCNVAMGPPSKLADLPDTMTAYLLQPKFAVAVNNTENLGFVLNRNDFEVLLYRSKVFGMRWTPSQDGVVFGLRPRITGERTPATTRFMHASLDGKVTEIAAVERDYNENPYGISDFYLTADRNFLIVQGGFPLIWNVAKSAPQVTPYDALVPSVTSDRFLGIEIDTRQLVLVDRDFQVARRFDVRVPPYCDIAWSPDERFALCRQEQEDEEREEPSNPWRGMRVDLETGEKRGFRGYYWTTDRCAFTGRGGEFILFGVRGFLSEHVDRMVGAHLWLFPNGAEPARKLVRYEEPEHLTGFYESARRYGYPPVIPNPDATLFAMPLPRDSKAQPGYLYHFVDREGVAQPWTPYDPSDYLAPAQVLAFANKGQTVVARTNDQLLSIPVADILRRQEPSP